MAGEAVKVQTVLIPAPTGGVNYVDNPTALQPNEARFLQNYFVYPWGIQQRSRELTHLSVTYASCKFFPYYKDGVDQMVIYKSGDFYQLDSQEDTTPTSIGVATRTGLVPQACYFNKRIFFFNAKEIPVNFTISAGTGADASFTGPTGGGTNLGYGWSYKSRMYAFERVDYDAAANPTRVWYTGVDAISGAMTSVDFGSIFSQSGSLSCGFSWSVNQGIQSEELFCLVSDSGEMLIYSGDYPASPNWQLIARIKVPAPTAYSNKRILKIGLETYLNTIIGLVPMSQIFASRVGTGLEVAALTRKLGPRPIGDPYLASSNIMGGEFAFSVGDLGVLALNVETGSWSYLKFSGIPTDVCVLGNYLYFSMTSGVSRIALTKYYHYFDTNAENSAQSYARAIWKTPFVDLGTEKKKKISRVKVIGTDLSTALSFKNTVYCKADYDDSLSDTTGPTLGLDSASTTTVDSSLKASPERPYFQELRPPGVGSRISFCFNKLPENVLNEIYGLEATYEVGGLY